MVVNFEKNVSKENIESCYVSCMLFGCNFYKCGFFEKALYCINLLFLK